MGLIAKYPASRLVLSFEKKAKTVVAIKKAKNVEPQKYKRR
jgi:hypothetical protein